MKASKIRCLVSAGPTREYFDPVRYMSNPSSGKMGYAIAEAAVAKGWEVDLVSGPVALPAPEGVRLHSVVTGEEMLAEMERLFDGSDIVIMTAAVMDYRPAIYSESKVKKTGEGMTVELLQTPDIIRTVAARKTRQLVVAFAAETDDIEAHAQEKLERKNADYVVANHVGRSGRGFESDDNEVLLLSHEGVLRRIGPDSKRAIAAELVEFFAGKLPE